MIIQAFEDSMCANPMNANYSSRPATLPLPMMILSSVLSLQACNSNNQEYDPNSRTASYALPPATESPMAQAINKHAEQHPGEHSGFLLLPEGLSAFVARVALIHEARVSLDVQYYEFKDDTAGNLLASKLLEAADRGVRVRLLVDDVATRIDNPDILTLSKHPNMEIRVFNPVAGRSGFKKALEQVRNLGRINHRMHNKLLVADSLAMITGGRNIADEYFSSTSVKFLDADILVIGHLLPRAAATFDEYWNHPVSVPVSQLMLDDDDSRTLEEIRAQIRKFLREHARSEFREALEKSEFSERLTEGRLQFHWGPATLYSDPPEKALDKNLPEHELPGYHLKEALADTESLIRISSAYFVPGDPGVELFTGLARNGVDVGILTNSLSSTDVAAVHAGYAPDRVRLMQGGVKLWELRPGADQEQRRHLFQGSASAALHAKTFVIDNNRSFIGSINMDSRSLRQNTEIGVLIENTAINSELRQLFDSWVTPDSAWKLSLGEEGEGDGLRWTAEEDGKTVTYEKDPDTSAWDRFVVWLLTFLPIESQV
ncbi:MULTISPECIES: phospholipase D family protein [Microbulbifer]|uniref:phospholipase D family protein n=1 Tax=Microbulbifer TaxID=48073 RepID=UPI001F37FF49